MPHGLINVVLKYQNDIPTLRQSALSLKFYPHSEHGKYGKLLIWECACLLSTRMLSEQNSILLAQAKSSQKNTTFSIRHL